MSSIPITEVADVIRSKNAGPYELTLDIMFTHEHDYQRVKEMNLFTPELFAELYGVTTDQIIRVVYFDPAWAVKCTMVRPVVSGSPGDTDVYGAQQHAPLLRITIPYDDS